MVKKILIALVAFAASLALAYGVGVLAGARDGVSMPQAITADSPCPVVGCADGNCHGFDNVPQPDGIHTMDCPEVSCSSAECHAWDTLANRYHQASDASLNVWVLAPILLVVALVLIVKRVGKKDGK